MQANEYRITLTNGYVHQINAFGIAVEQALELAPFVAKIEVNGQEMTIDEMRAGVNQRVAHCQDRPIGSIADAFPEPPAGIIE